MVRSIKQISRKASNFGDMEQTKIEFKHSRHFIIKNIPKTTVSINFYQVVVR